MPGWVSGLLGRLKQYIFPQEDVQRAFRIETAVSPAMEQNIGLWYAMYVNRPPWETAEVRAIGLPGAIARELARPTLTEFSIQVSGSPRGAYLNGQIQRALCQFKLALELGLALGGVALRPFVEGGRVLVDATSAAAFAPTVFDGAGRAMGGVFRELAQVGGRHFVRLEAHGFEAGADGTQAYVIRNKAYRSDSGGTPGEEAPLSSVPKWAGVAPETRINGLRQPLFAYFKPPGGNGVDPGSPVGASVYGGAAVELIREADEQWDLLRWEYKSGERKIFADDTSVNISSYGRDRLYAFGPFHSASPDFFQAFTPDFRDEPLYRGFQHILQRIEFQVGLSYGTLSDPQAVEKTATEILTAKQRMYVTIRDLQGAFQTALDDLLYAMDGVCSLYNLAPPGIYQAEYSWGDGVLDDPESRRQDMALDLQQVAAGILNPWEFRVKWYREDEGTARARLPELTGLVGGGSFAES